MMLQLFQYLEINYQNNYYKYTAQNSYGNN
jgi:hypothetical protein